MEDGEWRMEDGGWRIEYRKMRLMKENTVLLQNRVIPFVRFYVEPVFNS